MQKAKNQKNEFFRYDKAGQEQKAEELQEIDEDDEAFNTDTLEATAEIQGFRLDSLAWIDTPGLGSMTTINGKLAQKYIESADFIIFPTNSDSAFQRDEKEEVKKLNTDLDTKLEAELKLDEPSKKKIQKLLNAKAHNSKTHKNAQLDKLQGVDTKEIQTSQDIINNEEDSYDHYNKIDTEVRIGYQASKKQYTQGYKVHIAVDGVVT